jgi:hypothetical protein
MSSDIQAEGDVAASFWEVGSEKTLNKRLTMSNDVANATIC